MVPYPVLVSLSFDSLVRARCTGLFPLWAGILLCSYPLDRLAAAVTCLAQAQLAARRQLCDRFSRPCLQVAILLPALNLPGTSLHYRCCPAYAWQACVRAATHQPCLAQTRKEGRKEGDVRSGRSPLSAPTSAFGLKLGGDLARGTARCIAPPAQICRETPGPDGRSAPGARTACTQRGPGRGRARLRSDGTVSTIKYRALSALAMLGVEGARRQRERA
jgi:hypothetical protein